MTDRGPVGPKLMPRLLAVLHRKIRTRHNFCFLYKVFLFRFVVGPVWSFTLNTTRLFSFSPPLKENQGRTYFLVLRGREWSVTYLKQVAGLYQRKKITYIS